MSDTPDLRDTVAVTEEHLADVTEETVAHLVEGANFLVECPECEREWVLAVEPMALAALSNEYGNRAVEGRFRALALSLPAVTCGVCVFRGRSDS